MNLESIKGIYSTNEKAIERMNILKSTPFSFDEVQIKEYTIDEDIDEI